MDKKLIFVMGLILILASSVISFAAPDYYAGDASVYTGVSVPPNIMFLFDVSDNMTKAGSAIDYQDGVDYIAEYEELTGEESKYISDRVYVQLVAGTANDAKMTVNEDNDGYYVSYDSARMALDNNGTWIGSLAKGELDTKADQTYFTGDMACLMFELSNVPLAGWDNTEGKTYSVGDVIEGDIDGNTYKFACIQAGTPGASEPTWNPESVEITDGSVIWQPAKSALAVAASVLKMVAQELAGKVNLGVAVLDELNIGARIAQPLISTTTSANLTTFNAAMDELEALEISGNHWQVNEALWDVGTYYNGDTSAAFSSRTKNVVYPDAVEYWCQSNNIILVTSGMDSPLSKTAGAVDDLVTTTASGTPDPDGSALDVAKHLYDNLDPSYLDTEGHSFHVKTHVIQLFSELEQLQEVAYYGGDGLYYSLSSAEELRAILSDFIIGLLELDSSFVAPVVPASPENRAYSGQRIYLGFFKPQEDEPWYGNLKKFGLSSSSQITAFDGSGDLIDATADDGSFYDDPPLSSFWSSTTDGGQVDAGGVGALLKSGTTASRDIYTYAEGSDGALSEFTVANGASLATGLGKTDIAEVLAVIDNAEAEKVIGFVRGDDTYGADPTAKRPWFMGDIMHSKPVVLNYSSFNPGGDDDGDDTLNEYDSSVNDTYIFVGANDGMLHAFRDVDGSEAWAFIPQDLLPNLQYLTDTNRHYYFVDNSPVVYVYDADDDGNIEDGDQVILICGMRRGGGTNTITSGSQGSYFALDITVPETPTFMWQINSDVTDFGEMGQTWSLPRITKMKVDDVTKVVAVFGAGYDTNEDLRYGANQKFPDGTGASTNTSAAPSGEGDTLSGGTSNAYEPRGRGLYIVEVATLDSDGISSLVSSGQLLWSYTNADNPSLSFSIPSDPLVVDRDSDGYTDHIYVGDTGGQLWRFNVADAEDQDNWNGTRIFTANPGYDADGADTLDVGRKIFYKPTATIYGDDTFIYFGTGDREHPLNTAVVDRFYVVRDRENDGTSPWPLNESDLVDVTSNRLQEDDFAPAYSDGSPTNSDGRLLSSLTGSLYSDGSNTYYGWYIKLNDNLGEKVLSTSKVFEGKAFFTTYETGSGSDPCEEERALGTARLYAVKATTGEAVFNFDLTNDDGTTDGNSRAETADGGALRKSDRSLNIGSGISSEPLIMVNKAGTVSVMVGRGGGFFSTGEVETVDPVFPVYWMKW